jgi:acetyl esterase
MALDPQANEILKEGAASGLPPVYTLSVEKARERMHNAFINKGIKEEIESIKDYTIPCPGYKIGVRVYSPTPQKKQPCLLFFHGGGWTLNDLETHDNLCRSISKRVEIVVASVDYRLSPENKYPAAIEDAYTALTWLYFNANTLNIDTEKIGVGGDSSGGTQAAVLCHLTRDRKGPKIAFQWMIYPVTDYFLPGTKSYIENEKGYSMNKDFMVWFWNNYLSKDADVNDPYISPLRATNFNDLPPAFIMTANYDPLRDEGEEYGKKLQSAGINAKVKRYEDQMHGFILQRHRIDNASKAFDDAVAELKIALK